MKKISVHEVMKVTLLLFCLFLLLYACGEKQAVKSQIELSELKKMTQSETSVSIGKMDWTDCIPIEPEEIKENIIGYTLMRTPEGVYYVRDSDYLLEKDIIGKGVFVSEYVNEIEVFIGQILINVIKGRGTIVEEDKQYFSDWALEQVQGTDWKALDTGGRPDSYLYYRSYTINYVFGDVGYDFTYTFYPDRDAIEETAQIVTVKILIDKTGIIRGGNVEINNTARAVITEISNIKGLFDDELQEEIIEEGILYQDKVVYEQSGSGLLISESAAVCAEEVGEIIIDVLESKGKNAAVYDMQFEDENAFRSFQELSWDQLDEGWMANPYYDCYYINDGSCMDTHTFLFYIYPNYDGMKTETASALTFRCRVNGSLGKFIYTDLQIYLMTKKEYQAARDWQGKKSAFKKAGEINGGGSKIEISMPENSLIPDFISNVTITKQDGIQKEKSSGKEDRVYIDKCINVDSLGEAMIENMKIGIVEWLDPASEIYEIIEDGWEVRQEYDAYYMAHNEKAGAQLYRYYFYWNKPGEKNEKVLVTDIWISQSGVTDTRMYWYMGRSHIKAKEDRKSDEESTVLENLDIDRYLNFDWSADNVLLFDHMIEPQDSARGWQFFLADIDFDGKLEMLIAFTANHCGNNSLYIYRQEKGKVVSYIDTIATPKEYVEKMIDYKNISPYMEINLLDAYVNKHKEYRYLSLDCSSFGGDMRGGRYTIVLYETVFGEAVTPKEIARITICGEEEEKQYFFLGKNVYEAGRLRDLLADYMYGYKKVDLDYIVLEKAFSRDIIGLSEEEQAQNLEELYESIRKIVENNAA